MSYGLYKVFRSQTWQLKMKISIVFLHKIENSNTRLRKCNALFAKQNIHEMYNLLRESRKGF